MTTLTQNRVELDTPHSGVSEYPESDGEPIGETDTHISNILSLRQALRLVFRRTESVYVAANMLFYYQEGNPAACRAPDVFVVPGVAKHDRRTFKVWEEGKVPGLIIEVTSKKSQVEDLWIKRGLYERLGVAEYILFDPLGEYLDPRFQVFELQEGQYVPVTPARGAGYTSRILGIELRPHESMLQVIDPSSGKPVPDLEEALDLAEAESQRVKALEEELRKYREQGAQPEHVRGTREQE